MKIKSFECPKSIISMKKIILGTSDSWSTMSVQSSKQPSMIYCRLRDFQTYFFYNSTKLLEQKLYKPYSVR